MEQHPAVDARPVRQILTVTLNPALDISASTQQVVTEHKLRCTGSRLDPGGGGVNVSRVIHRLGGRSLALYTAGGPIGEAYRRLVDAERVPSVVVPIAGQTRQSLSVEERATGAQYRFVLEGPALSGEEWGACLDLIGQTVAPGGFLVASGSLPPGVPEDFYARAVRLAREAGAETIVDASGPALREALAEGVFAVAPSGRELEQLAGVPLPTVDDRVEAAAALVADGSARYVALTLGADGAVLVSAEGALRLGAPVVDVVSAVGAGDSFVAAFVLRLAQSRPVQAAFRAAVAAGTAAVVTPATALCDRADVERFEAMLDRT